MKTRALSDVLGIGAALLLGVVGTWAAPVQGGAQTPPVNVPKYAPLSGATGYQEIKLTEDTWYVAFYGNRDNPLDVIEKAWSARAAQLCQGVHRAYFVQLRYMSEAVLKSQPGASARVLSSEGRAYRTGGPVYIPIFIPQPHPGVMPAVTTPNKLAAVRCIETPDQLLDPSRAVSAADALTAARTAGYRIP